jgi:AcrR family transcriptional regulator
MTRIWQHAAGAKGQQRLEEILIVAADLFVSRGYEQTSTLDIAAEVGIAKGSLYYYIGSKEELLFRIVLRNHDLLHSFVIAPSLADTDALEAIRTFITRHVTFTLTHGAASTLYRQQLRVVESVNEWREALTVARRAHEAALIDLIKSAQAGRPSSDQLDASLTARALLSMANSALNWYRGDGPHSVAAVAEHHAELAVRALAFQR